MFAEKKALKPSLSVVPIAIETFFKRYYVYNSFLL